MNFKKAKSILKKGFISLLSLGMTVTLLSSSAFASTTVTPSPNTGNSSVDSLEVEYFSSTLYNWDESAANAATAEADYNDSITSGVLSTASTGTAWTITKVDDADNGYTISTTIDGTEWYITWSGANSADAELTTTPTTIVIEYYSSNETISLCIASGGAYPYLNYYGSNQGFGGWSGNSSPQSNDEGSTFYIYNSTDTSTSITRDDIVSGSQYYIKNARANAYLTGTTSTSEGYEGKGFYFTNKNSVANIDSSSIAYFSKWSTNVGDQNYMIYSGLAASNLSDTDNGPFNTDVVNAANLFATDGSNKEYTDVYENVQVPFYIDEDGYYVLDSDTYGVYFDGGASAADDDATMAIADLPSLYYSTDHSKNIVGFAPFNDLSSTTNSGSNSTNTATTGYQIENYQSGSSSAMNYGFGMVTSVDFQMTDDGQIDGEDIIFEFSGDDDVWVYIDGVLALDIGGTHDAITGTINFATGNVTLTAKGYSYIGDKATDTVESSNTMSQTNLYDALETTLTGFASKGSHTMTIYYMDRGQGKTNCLIKFNLPQKDSVSVTKTIDSNYVADDGTYNTYSYTDDDGNTVEYGEISSTVMSALNNIDFSFTLYKDDEAVANKNYSIYDSSGTYLGSGTTDSNGNFTLKNGQTATFRDISLDSAQQWKVVENLSSERWGGIFSTSLSSNLTNATLSEAAAAKVTGTVNSQTVTLTDEVHGDSKSADSIVFNCTNSYVRGPDPDVDIADETIVLDYGLPVEVDVMANDSVTNYGEAITEGITLSITDDDTFDTNYADSETYGTLTKVNSYTDNEYTGEIEDGVFYGEYGYAEIVDGKLVYTLTEDFCGIEKVPYRITVTATVGTGDDAAIKTTTSVGTLTIIPATSVYYEEDFSITDIESALSDTDDTPYKIDDSESNFITTSKSKANTSGLSYVDEDADYGTYQETGLVGTKDDSTYGTDEHYINNLKDSNGTSLKADTTSGAVQYKYTFTGTGTTIYGRVSSSTGYILVTVTDITENYYKDTVKDSSGNATDTFSYVADQQTIDTINLVTKTSDGTDTILDETLYNIPIYQNTDLQYSTYEVTIYVYKAGTYTATSSNAGNEFYLDGIRVYQPMGTDEENTIYNTDGTESYTTDLATAESAYAQDGEANVSVTNIRTKVVADSENYDNTIVTLTDVQDNIVDVSAYNAIGPNEEFYLDGDEYSLSFALLNWDSQSYKLYLGMKAPNGEPASVTVGTKTLTLNNSADCYYDISDCVTIGTIDLYVTDDGAYVLDEYGNKTTEEVSCGIVTISGVSGLAALTNIKITGNDKFNIAYSEDIEVTTGNEASIATLSLDTVYLVSTSYASSLSVASVEEETVTYFEPSSIKTSCSYSSFLKIANVSVTTSTDVSYITVNGTKVTGTTLFGKKYFSKAYTKVSKGTTYEIIAYDSDGNASETYTVTAE